ncbi:hypothetical protein D9611_013736 [Ephemerocybe angulata]|uniref:Homeobox domain-containing protein n=1 Tax=Ephemerocybe angulata TaxID=980116 RepID=A0A8H5F1Q2_9AGAR|nr:hypothetical protein D9611_013736 [Tulosesus angulatus]
MARPPASAPKAPSNKRKCTPTTATIPKPPTTTLTPAHFARLSAIWALDRRIPTPASRAAWAAARGLDVEKVHKWWYRCRARAKKMGVEIPGGSYEMDVGDVETEEEAEAEEERKAREEKDRRRRVKVKEEEEEEEQVEGVQMSKMEEAREETQGKFDTTCVALAPQTLPVPTPLPPAEVTVEDTQQIQTGVDYAAFLGEGDTTQVALAPHTLAVHSSSAMAQALMEVDEAMETGEQDIPKLSGTTRTPGPSPTLPSSPIPTSSSPLTLSQCFLPPSSPFTSPPPRSAPSASASPPPPPDLPRLTRASKRMYLTALEYVPASDSKLAPLDDGKCTASTATSHPAPIQPLSERRTSLNDNIQPVSASKAKESKSSTKQVKKIAHRPATTAIIAPKTSKPSRKRPKSTRSPPVLPAPAPPVASRPSPPPSDSSPIPVTSRPPVDIDIEIDDPIPTPADLERALYAGITFERCLDISLSAVPFLFGLDACGFQFGYGGSGRR